LGEKREGGRNTGNSDLCEGFRWVVTPYLRTGPELVDERGGEGEGEKFVELPASFCFPTLFSRGGRKEERIIDQSSKKIGRGEFIVTRLNVVPDVRAKGGRRGRIGGETVKKKLHDRRRKRRFLPTCRDDSRKGKEGKRR